MTDSAPDRGRSAPIEPSSNTHDPGSPLVSEAVLDLAEAGDRAALDTVLGAVRPMVVRYCRARLRGRSGAVTGPEDVTQEVLLAVVSMLPRTRPNGAALRALVYGIAAHKVSDARRSEDRDRTRAVPEVPETADRSAGPEPAMLRSELSARVDTLLQELPERPREILVLRIGVGLSADETADAIGSTAGAVRVAQHRALCRLRDRLAAERDEWVGG